MQNVAISEGLPLIEGQYNEGELYYPNLFVCEIKGKKFMVCIVICSPFYQYIRSKVLMEPIKFNFD